MSNESDNTSGTDVKNNKTKNKRKKTLVYSICLLIVLLVLGIGYLLLSASNNKEVTTEEIYRFVNNNSVLCTHNISQNQIDCIDLDDNQTKSTKLPDEYKNVASIQPSFDGTRFLVSYTPDLEGTRYVVTNTDFSKPTDVEVPYEDAEATNITPEIIWGNSRNNLLISNQIREENDADFLPVPLVVWDYNIETKEAKRIYKNGDNEEITIKVIGASEEYLFITQPIHKNWVAEDTDPPADALLAVSLDDGSVRTVSIEQIVKLQNTSKYAKGISISYNPIVSTFYFSGQSQSSNDGFDNFYAATKLVSNKGLHMQELSRLTSQAQYYGIESTRGTLVADWTDDSEGFSYSFVTSADEVHMVQNTNSAKDNSKFTIATLSVSE